MRWVWLGIIAAFFAAIGFYVWHFNYSIETAAADNNGAVCSVELRLDDELYSIYQSAGFVNAVVTGLAGNPVGDTPVTSRQVVGQNTKLINEIQEVVEQVDLVAGSACDLTVTQFNAPSPGRIYVDVNYYRPFPIQGGSPDANSN